MGRMSRWVGRSPLFAGPPRPPSWRGAFAFATFVSAAAAFAALFKGLPWGDPLGTIVAFALLVPVVAVLFWVTQLLRWRDYLARHAPAGVRWAWLTHSTGGDVRARRDGGTTWSRRLRILGMVPLVLQAAFLGVVAAGLLLGIGADRDVGAGVFSLVLVALLVGLAALGWRHPLVGGALLLLATPGVGLGLDVALTLAAPPVTSGCCFLAAALLGRRAGRRRGDRSSPGTGASLAGPA
jgi:hypothetical protein